MIIDLILQAMRVASGFCAAGWLAIYFAQVYFIKQEKKKKFLRICSETLPHCDSGGSASGYRKASNWIRNGSLFLCGMFFQIVNSTGFKYIPLWI